MDGGKTEREKSLIVNSKVERGRRGTQERDEDDDDVLATTTTTTTTTTSAKWSRLNAGENSFSQTKGIRPEIIPRLQKVVNYLDFLVRSPALTPFRVLAAQEWRPRCFYIGTFFNPFVFGVPRRLGTIAISRGSLIGC